MVCARKKSSNCRAADQSEIFEGEHVSRSIWNFSFFSLSKYYPFSLLQYLLKYHFQTLYVHKGEFSCSLFRKIDLYIANVSISNDINFKWLKIIFLLRPFILKTLSKPCFFKTILICVRKKNRQIDQPFFFFKP